jgi:hypothetical protein
MTQSCSLVRASASAYRLWPAVIQRLKYNCHNDPELQLVGRQGSVNFDLQIEYVLTSANLNRKQSEITASRRECWWKRVSSWELRCSHWTKFELVCKKIERLNVWREIFEKNARLRNRASNDSEKKSTPEGESKKVLEKELYLEQKMPSVIPYIKWHVMWGLYCFGRY